MKVAELAIARRRIESFGKRRGEAHLQLARQAAFPLALTPDILYGLWANFQRDSNGEYLDIPWIAVTDLLLSSLCEEVGYELYEMDENVRNVLLEQLKNQPNLGQPRINQLAAFILDYIQRKLLSDDLETQDFAKAQKWSALAYTNPHEAARELSLELANLDQQNTAELLRITAIIETLAEPLADFKSLLTYARGMESFARGDLQKATNKLASAITVGNQIQSVGVTLPIPREIRTNLSSSSTLPRRVLVAVGATALIGAIGVTALSFFLTQRAAQNIALELPTIHPLYGTPLATSISELIDVQPNDWYFQALQSLVERYGIIYPREDGTFRGNRAITRAELVDLLSTALIRIDEQAQTAFNNTQLCRYNRITVRPFHAASDVDPNAWFYTSYRNIDNLIGMANYPDGTFREDRAMTRYEMAALFNAFFNGVYSWLASQLPQNSSSTDPPLAKLVADDHSTSLDSQILAQVTTISQFSDVHPTHWAFQALQSAVERHGMTAGYPDGTFRGNRAVTRGEVASNLNSGLDRLGEFTAAKLSDCNSPSSSPSLTQ